ncbi:hypothetical protein K439DRAFT_1626236 [Ramaria rubella]|nr:hypothetical protein K439DRAFT_1626236 [Ramaria rubella]
MSEAPPQALVALPQDLLLCIFIHGFKGTDETFGGFPDRLRHILTETIDNIAVECIVFPAYETKGELNAAVERFADWLTTLTVEREVAHGTGGGAGKAKIVLCGHSMGGLLAADTFIAMANSRPDKSAPLWPRIIACLAFDTPYLGIQPSVFKNSASKAVGYVQTARDIAAGAGALGTLGSFAFGNSKKAPDTNSTNPKEKEQEAKGLVTSPPPGSPPPTPPGSQSQTPIPSGSTGTTPAPTRSGWGKWAPVAYGAGAAILAGAAAGAAYYRREDVTFGWAWATDHMKYVKNLWDVGALKMRVENVVGKGEELGVVFRTFYTYLPGKPPANPQPRTFIILPQSNSPYARYFVRAHNSFAVDEVGAHTTMFQGTSNDGYYELGLETAKIIREAVILARGVGVVAKGESGVEEVKEG